jgi:serine protease AprX
VAAALSGAQKIAPELKKANPNSIVNVIVQRKPGALPLDGLLNAVGAKKLLDHALIGAQTIQVAVSALDQLAASPDVVYISPDRAVSILSDHYEFAVNAPAAWNLSLDGSGVGVAVIDSGIAASPDLRPAVYTEIFNGKKKDGFGHGTHVSGIIAGNGASSSTTGSTNKFAGIAPGVNLIDLQVLNELGGSTDSVVIAAIERAVQLKDTYNIRVINLSLGRPVAESYALDPLCLAVEQAWKAGIVVVVAAGNSGRSGYGSILSPANDPYVITVGAMKSMDTPQRSDDQIASYSSKGPTAIDHIIKPDLVAPGNRIISVLSTGSTLAAMAPQNIVSPAVYGLSANSAPSYIMMSGTSMAAPMVSAAAALLLQQDRTLSPDTVKARLMKTAYKAFPSSSIATEPSTGAMYSSYYDIFTVGAGYLDIYAALMNRDSLSEAALSPAATFDSVGGQAALVPGLLATWAKSGNWASRIVWGNTVLLQSSGLLGGLNGALTGSAAIWGSAAAWNGLGTRGTPGPAGTSAMWGTSAAWGDSAMWGTSAAWGDSAMWGTSAAWGDSAMWGTSTTTMGER